MKSWLVFASGGLVGAAVALGVVKIFFPAGTVVESQRADGPGRGGVEVTGAGNGGQVKSNPEKKAEMDERELDERIGGLRAWSEGRGERPDWMDLRETLETWAERDPHGALAWAQTAKRLPQRTRVLSVALAVLAGRNPAEAAQWMRQNTGEHERIEMMVAVFQSIDGTAPKAALELALAFPEKDQPYDMGGALAELMKTSPQESVMYFNRLPASRQASSAHAMISAWARIDAAAVLQWAEGQAGAMGSDDWKGQLMVECAQKRPDLCLDFMKRHEIPESSWEGTRAVSLMLEHSPEHGMQALALLREGAAAVALGMWARDSFEESPERAVELVKKWVPEADRATVLRDGFEAWLDSDRRAAMDWLGAVADPQLRTTLQTGVISWQAQRDPAAALAVLTGPQAASPELKDVVERALSQWVHMDAEAAANWVVANPERVMAHQAAELAGMFLHRNEEAAADWLAKLPAGDTRDAAVEAAALYWADGDEQELASQVAGSIRDPEKRARTIFEVYKMLRERDAGEVPAEKWLAAAGVSEETKRSWRTLTGGR